MQMKYIVGAVVVVAILFAVGVLSPAKFRQIKCRMKQQDGTSNLKEIRKRTADHLSKGDRVSNLNDLDWAPKTFEYDYNINVGFSGHFSIEAKANDLNGDVWTIDEGGTLVNKVNGCAVAR